jgi:hypothetical protein
MDHSTKATVIVVLDQRWIAGGSLQVYGCCPVDSNVLRGLGGRSAGVSTDVPPRGYMPTRWWPSNSPAATRSRGPSEAGIRR